MNNSKFIQKRGKIMINIANIPKAYSEVYALLNVVENEYVKKIPKNIYNSIKNNRDFN